MTVAPDPGRTTTPYGEALDLFELALNRQFRDLDVDLTAAMVSFEQTADPHLKAAHAAVIATVHRQELRYDDAGDWFDRALRSAPARSWSRGLALVLKAGLLAWQGNLADAGAAVDDVLSFIPDDLRPIVELQRAYVHLAADRGDEALALALAIQRRADRLGDVDLWAMARLVEARIDSQRDRQPAAEVGFRSVLLRSSVHERIRITANAGLGIDLARQGAMSSAIDRFEQARLHFETWPRAEMEFGPTFTATYLDANLLELADTTAARTVAAAIRLNESIIHASALMAHARVDIARGKLEAAHGRLDAALSMFVAQDRPQAAAQARRLLACLDPDSPPDWLTTDHFSEDPSTVRALLATADAHPDQSEQFWTIAAHGVDASDTSVRAMARCALIRLQLASDRIDDARDEVDHLLAELRRRNDGVDALDVRAAGFELVDVRSISVAFARAGDHDLLFDTLDSIERSIFDFVLDESAVAVTRTQLEQLRASLAETPSEDVEADELTDLDRRIAELRRTRESSSPPVRASERVPRMAFVAADGHAYRLTYDATGTTFADIGSATQLTSRVRRLRFAVAAASIDPLGDQRIAMAAAALQDALFHGLEIAESQEYSIRPGQYLIAVPWRLLPIGLNRQIALRIRGPRPPDDPTPRPHRVLAVACTDEGGHAAHEAAAVGAHYDEATLLIGADSTPDAFLTACVDHDVAHIAGYQALVQRERLVTTLLLGGGPVTMFDLGQIARVPPIVVVASSRVSAVHSNTHDVNLALAQTLIARGAREVVVSPVDLAPEISVVVLPALHALLASGLGAAAALDALSFDDPHLQRAADCLVCIEAE